MSNYLISMPVTPFSTPRAFKAVANGKIYIGLPDTDPVNPANQIPVYIVNESGTEVQIAQPIIINAGGFPVYNGQIAKFITKQNYSMEVRGSNNVQQYYWPDLSRVDPDALTQVLLSKRVYAIDFGPVSGGTKTIQDAIDYVYADGGGVVDLGPFVWAVGPSTLAEVYDNFGVPIPASNNAIILRKGVSLVGQKGKTKITCSNPSISVIAIIAPVNNLLSGFEVAGGATNGTEGPEHGIVQYGTQGGVDTSCSGVVFEDLYVHNVGSYAISMSNGNPTNCHIMRCRTHTTGADGIDLKARGSSAIPPYANTVSDTWVSNYNLRVDGSAGIDIRGIWHLSGITMSDFGGNAAKTYSGVRFRTKPPITDPYNKAAAKSTLTGFTVTPTPGSAALNIYGIECGSDDVNISNGTVEDCTIGVFHTGNSVGPAVRGTVSNVVSINARQYGFRTLVGNIDIKYIGCTDTGATTAGFRVEGQNITASACVGTLSITGGAAPSFTYPGSRLWDSYGVIERVTDAIIALTARGAVADVAIRLVPKGAGHVGVYGDLRPDAANTRYVGSNSLPWAGGFTQTAFTVTSGARFKTDPLEITDAMLDAAAECPPIQYQLLDRVAIKGADNARWHFGTIAERLEEAFARHGLDVRRFAFFCEDYVSYKAAVIDEETGLILDPEQEEGVRLGVRYEELLMLEAALQRRNYQRLLAQQESLAARLDALENQRPVSD